MPCNNGNWSGWNSLCIKHTMYRQWAHKASHNGSDSKSETPASSSGVKIGMMSWHTASVMPAVQDNLFPLGSSGLASLKVVGLKSTGLLTLTPVASATECQGHAHICAFRFSRVNSGYEVDWI